MTSDQTERKPSRMEQLRKEIQESSKEVVTLREMLRMGFWPKDKPVPVPDLEKLIRIKFVTKRIQELRQEIAKGVTWNDLVKKVKKDRMQQSKQRVIVRREEEKKKYEERKAAWQLKRKEDIVHVGIGYSTLLKQTETNVDQLQANNLPLIQTLTELAKCLNVDLKTLRWLSYHRDVVEVSHYVFFQVPKRTGGMRTISAPKAKLAAAQHWIFENILQNLGSSEYAHGFLRGRSIKTNALAHANPAIVVNLDLKDCFPSITFIRVAGIFKKLGYSGKIATLLAMICTESPRQEINVEGRKLYVATGPRALPQGSCCSPALTNLVCRRLDLRLHGLAQRAGFTYTRYADDLTLSTPNGASREVLGKLLGAARRILKAEGFEVNEKKVQVFGKHRRQTITGLQVNEGTPAIPRFWLRRLRGLLHRCLVNGIDAEDRTGNLVDILKGMVAYVQMITPEKARIYREQLKELLK